MILCFQRRARFALITRGTSQFVHTEEIPSLKAPNCLHKSLAIALFTTLLAIAPVLASAAANAEANPLWNGILLLVVLMATAASAALPISAYKYWTGYWKLVAAIPLLLLLGWSAWIVIAKLLQTAAHPYWLLELFAWAMLTMLYMATMLTAKRQFEKADNSQQQ